MNLGLRLRRYAGAVLAAFAAAAPAGVVRADAAEPTDFRSEITAVTPATDAVEVAVAGGDAFVVLTARPGTTVEILGYRGEPYLVFDADGTVRENVIAPTTLANRERFGAAPVSADAVDPRTVAPQWEVVATDGSYAWHDHRAHWMVPDPPSDAVPGAVFEVSELPLTVDGQPVVVGFAYRWLEPPSTVGTVAGLIVGAFVVLIVLSARRSVAVAVAALALAAAGVGWWQYRSFPASADPLLTWWLLPALGAAVSVVAVVLWRTLLGKAALLLGGLLVGLWVFLRRDGFTKAVLPTDAPFWLDRGVTAAAALGAFVAVIAGAVAMFRLPAPDSATPSPAEPERQTTTWGRKR